MEKIPFINFAPQTAKVKADLLKAVEFVLDGGNFILGPEVEAFEKEFADYCGVKNAIGVSDGTAALYLALRALDIGAGDEVITVSNSFIATVSAIVLAGAKPIFVEVGPDLNMDHAKLEAAITLKTKAIMPVHLTGRLANMEPITEIARQRNLYIIEDAAQAVGASFNGRKAGSFGNIGCFSLHPLKTLHAFGDAGMVTVRDDAVYEKIRSLRNIGMKDRNVCQYWSFNCRLDELQAALLRINLRHLDEWTNERRRLAMRYNKVFKDFAHVCEEKPGERCVYQTYVIQVSHRDELYQYLIDNGIDVKIHYRVPIHLQPVAKELGLGINDLPETIKRTKKILSLPIYPGLTEQQQDRIIALVKMFYESRI